MIVNNSNSKVETTYYTEYGIITFGKKSTLHGLTPTDLAKVEFSPKKDIQTIPNSENNSNGWLTAGAIAFVIWLFGRNNK